MLVRNRKEIYVNPQIFEGKYMEVNYVQKQSKLTATEQRLQLLFLYFYHCALNEYNVWVDMRVGI